MPSTPRQLITTNSTLLPTHSKAGSNTYTDILAGTIIGVIALLLLAVFIYTRCIARRAAARDEEAALPPSIPLQLIAPPTNPNPIPPVRNPTTPLPPQLPPTIRLITSPSHDSLQAGLDRVEYDRELRMGTWGVDQELRGNPTYLRIPPRRSSLGFERAVEGGEPG